MGFIYNLLAILSLAGFLYLLGQSEKRSKSRGM